jgi:L-amino acid N-acyltransferase YncA
MKLHTLIVDLLLAAIRAANNEPGAECDFHTHLKRVEVAVERKADELSPGEWQDLICLSCSS